jgi:uncharacterized membrane-anchored protein
MNLGLNALGVDGVLYGLQIALGLLVYFAVKTPGYGSLILLGAAYLMGIGFFTVIHFMNRAVTGKTQKEDPKGQSLPTRNP